MTRIEVDKMVIVKKADVKIFLSGKPRIIDKENKIFGFGLPRIESESLDKNSEYLIIIEGPINSKRTKNDRIVISI